MVAGKHTTGQGGLTRGITCISRVVRSMVGRVGSGRVWVRSNWVVRFSNITDRLWMGRGGIGGFEISRVGSVRSDREVIKASRVGASQAT